MTALGFLPTESGLSECARLPSAPSCGDLDGGLTVWVVGVSGLVIYLLLAGCATVAITRTDPHRKAWWLAIVWGLPVAGALSWLAYRMAIRWGPRRAKRSPADHRIT